MPSPDIAGGPPGPGAGPGPGCGVPGPGAAGAGPAGPGPDPRPAAPGPPGPGRSIGGDSVKHACSAASGLSAPRVASAGLGHIADTRGSKGAQPGYSKGGA